MATITRNILIEKNHWRQLQILSKEKDTNAQKIIRKLISDYLIKEGKIKQEEELLWKSL